jgi:hypothetical protein
VEPLRDEHLEGLSQHGAARASKHVFGGGVELHHALLPVDGDDGVHGRLDDAAHARLHFPQPALRELAVGLLPVDEQQGGQRGHAAGAGGNHEHFLAAEAEDGRDDRNRGGEGAQADDRTQQHEQRPRGQGVFGEGFEGFHEGALTRVKGRNRAPRIVPG